MRLPSTDVIYLSGEIVGVAQSVSISDMQPEWEA